MAYSLADRSACLPESEADLQGDFMRRILTRVLVTIIAAAVAMVVVLFACAVWPVADTYPRNVVQTKAGPVEYTLLGQGPVVLRLTGSMVDSQSSGGNEALLAAGFSVLTPSRPGYGKTPLSTGKTAPEAADAWPLSWTDWGFRTQT